MQPRGHVAEHRRHDFSLERGRVGKIRLDINDLPLRKVHASWGKPSRKFQNLIGSVFFQNPVHGFEAGFEKRCVTLRRALTPGAPGQARPPCAQASQDLSGPRYIRVFPAPKCRYERGHGDPVEIVILHQFSVSQVRDILVTSR